MEMLNAMTAEASALLAVALQNGLQSISGILRRNNTVNAIRDISAATLEAAASPTCPRAARGNPDCSNVSRAKITICATKPLEAGLGGPIKITAVSAKVQSESTPTTVVVIVSRLAIKARAIIE